MNLHATVYRRKDTMFQEDLHFCLAFALCQNIVDSMSRAKQGLDHGPLSFGVVLFCAWCLRLPGVGMHDAEQSSLAEKKCVMEKPI